VQKVWVNRDTDLMDVTITGGGRTSVIRSTQHHLFWDATTKTWTEAENLHTGDALYPNAGTKATVVTTAIVPGSADMWDLTVGTDHDFYITSAVAAVLVHNCPIGGGDHVVLGKSLNLQKIADSVGGRTLMDDPDWKQSLLDTVLNPDSKISVSLDDVEGEGTYSQVMGSAQRGMNGTGQPFDWEMGQLYSNDRLSSTTFLRGGSVVDNPFR
jgi:hypothetical protein